MDVLRPAPHGAEAFAFLLDPPALHAFSGWTVVLPVLSLPVRFPGVRTSQMWAQAVRDSESDRQVKEGADGQYDEKRVVLRFALRSLAHTRATFSREVELRAMMLSRFVKFNMLRLDVLQPFERLCWIDSSLQVSSPTSKTRWGRKRVRSFPRIEAFSGEPGMVCNTPPLREGEGSRFDRASSSHRLPPCRACITDA